jgi:hypothetical protein
LAKDGKGTKWIAANVELKGSSAKKDENRVKGHGKGTTGTAE